MEDLTGRKFGRLLVIKFDKREGKYYHWLCKCDCGTRVIVPRSALVRGHTKSCGCLQKEKAKKIGERSFIHGMSQTTTYNIWRHLFQRCTNNKNVRYNDYGGRGITVCKRWEKFSNFYKDMGKCPKGKSIDRIDNNKGYCKENCRWATSIQQNRNRRDNYFIIYQREKLCLAEWAEKLEMNYHTLYYRINESCWSIEKAFETPVLKRK